MDRRFGDSVLKAFLPLLACIYFAAPAEAVGPGFFMRFNSKTFPSCLDSCATVGYSPAGTAGNVFFCGATGCRDLSVSGAETTIHSCSDSNGNMVIYAGLNYVRTTGYSSYYGQGGNTGNIAVTPSSSALTVGGTNLCTTASTGTYGYSAGGWSGSISFRAKGGSVASSSRIACAKGFFCVK